MARNEIRSKQALDRVARVRELLESAMAQSEIVHRVAAEFGVVKRTVQYDIRKARLDIVTEEAGVDLRDPIETRAAMIVSIRKRMTVLRDYLALLTPEDSAWFQANAQLSKLEGQLSKLCQLERVPLIAEMDDESALAAHANVLASLAPRIPIEAAENLYLALDARLQDAEDDERSGDRDSNQRMRENVYRLGAFAKLSRPAGAPDEPE